MINVCKHYLNVSFLVFKFVVLVFLEANNTYNTAVELTQSLVETSIALIQYHDLDDWYYHPVLEIGRAHV